MQQAHQKQGEDVARIEGLCVTDREKELRRLVRLVSDYHNFSRENYEEALEIALGDFDSAMTCFTSLANKAGLL